MHLLKTNRPPRRSSRPLAPGGARCGRSLWGNLFWGSLIGGSLIGGSLLGGGGVSGLAVAQEAPGEGLGDGLGGLLEGLDLEAPAAPPASRAPEPSTPESNAPQPNTSQPTAPQPTAAGPLLEAYRSMRAANALLARGETGQATRSAQQRAVELLDQMIEAAEQQSESGGPRDPSAQPQPAGQAPQDASPQQSAMPQQQPGEAGQGGDAEQGSGDERAAGDEAGEPGSTAGGPGQPAGQQPVAAAAAGEGSRPGIRSAGAEAAVWGHLPERTRGMLRSEMPTEYLPAYATEISEYFRRLAEMQPDE